MHIRIAPSLLAADFGRLGEEIRRAEEAGVDLLHLDVMDGHFVPNFTIGPFIVEAVRKLTKLELMTHLMIEEPTRYVRPFADAGADTIVCHVELPDEARHCLEQIRELGRGAGLAINPETPWESLLPYAKLVDTITVMTVHPGFGGQKLIPEALEKVRHIRTALPEIDITVDGGINPENAPAAVNLGATTLVAGTALFRSADMGRAVAMLRQAKLSVKE